MKLKTINMSAGVFVNSFDYETMALCMKEGLSRYYKENCESITELWPTGAGALMFYQV